MRSKHSKSQNVRTRAVGGFRSIRFPRNTWLALAAALLSAFLTVAVGRSLSLPAITLEPSCGFEEHEHTEDCYAPDGTLICELPEHRHSDECYARATDDTQSADLASPDDVAADEDVQSVPLSDPDPVQENMGDVSADEGASELSTSGDGYSVTIVYGTDAALPEGTTLEAKELDPASEEYADHLNQALVAANISEEEASLYTARFFDITLLANGAPIEPAAPIQVTIACDAPAVSSATGAAGDEILTTASATAGGVDAAGTLSSMASTEAIIAHFASEGIELIEPELAPAAAVEADLDVAYTYDQSSFSVSGLIVRNSDPTTLSRGTMIAKRRNQSEIENGGVYLVYCVIGEKPYAIGLDGALHELSRAGNGYSIYQSDGGSISNDLLWTVDHINTFDDGFKAVIRNVSDTGYILYPRGGHASVVENNSGNTKAYFRRTGNNTYEFYLCDNDADNCVTLNGSTLNIVGYSGASPRQFYIAEVPSESTHTASYAGNPATIIEGYYIISRTTYRSASDVGNSTTALDFDLTVQARSQVSGFRQLSGFYNSEIWYIKPASNGSYTVTNVWSGERLSPESGTTSDTLKLIPTSSGGAYHIQSVANDQWLNNRTNNYGYWDSGWADYTLYRIDDVGYAYFDVTDGGNSHFYRGISTDFQSRVEYALDEDGGTAHTITLPTAEQVGDTTAYHYHLHGWYDIYNKKWYEPGTRVKVTGNAVFYADWIAATYDIGQYDANHKAPNEVYSPAITTTLFDYNELMNTRFATLSTTAAANVTTSVHTESWHDMTPYDETGIADGSRDSFLFVYGGIVRGTQEVNPTSALCNVNGRVYQNQSHSTVNDERPAGAVNGDYFGIVTPTIYTPELQSLLFDPEVPAIGKTYVGDDHWLYSYDYDTGYYYYDSNRNAASYNASAERFYVYDYVNLTDKSTHETTDGTLADAADFLPLNYGEQTFSEFYGGVNYWFGMKTEFYFFLPNNADPTADVNKSIMGDDLAFHFSGDDDVWVLVDDNLVLDLGGMHGTVYGEINFSDCTVTVGQNGAAATYELKDGSSVRINETSRNMEDELKIIGVDNTNGGVTTTTSSYLSGLEAGNHKLTLLYLERGSSESNAAIYFNIAPVYQLRLEKVDGSNDNESLDGATFEVYTDEACTTLASNLTPITYDTITTNHSDALGYSGTGGIFYLDGLVANQNYYFKEVTAPAGYRPLRGPIRIRIDGNVLTGTYMYPDANGKLIDGETFEVTSTSDNFNGSYGGFTIQIPNYTGREIPSAGGMGTRALVGSGLTLVALALAGLVLRGRLAARQLVVALLVAALALQGFGRPAFADEGDPGDTQSDPPPIGSVTVNFEAEGMPFELYRVGEKPEQVTDGLKLQPIPATENLGIDWGIFTTGESLSELAETLAAAASAGEIEPVATAEVVEGTARFDIYEEGLYVVVGGSVEYDSYTWSAVPTLLSIPDVFGTEGNDVTITPKQAKVPIGPDQIEYLLVKQWIDDAPQLRPEGIRVALSKGGEYVETVTLDASNNWCYRWEADDDGVPWTAAELGVPDGYTWAVETEGTRITLRNTYHEPEEPESPGTPEEPSKPQSLLAQTGDSSFQIAALASMALIGTGFILAGLFTRRERRSNSSGRERHARNSASAKRARSRKHYVFLTVGVCILVAMGFLLWQNSQAENLSSQALTSATDDLIAMVPDSVELGIDDASQGHSLAALAVDGHDFVGCLSFADADELVGIQSLTAETGPRLSTGDPRSGTGEIVGLEVEADLVHPGVVFEFVDVDGHAYCYMVDHVAADSEDTSDALLLSIEGMTDPLLLVCFPCK